MTRDELAAFLREYVPPGGTAEFDDFRDRCKRVERSDEPLLLEQLCHGSHDEQYIALLILRFGFGYEAWGEEVPGWRWAYRIRPTPDQAEFVIGSAFPHFPPGSTQLRHDLAEMLRRGDALVFSDVVAFIDLFWNEHERARSFVLDHDPLVIVDAAANGRRIIFGRFGAQLRYWLTLNRDPHQPQVQELGHVDSLEAAAALCREFLLGDRFPDQLASTRTVRHRYAD